MLLKWITSIKEYMCTKRIAMLTKLFFLIKVADNFWIWNKNREYVFVVQPWISYALQTQHMWKHYSACCSCTMLHTAHGVCVKRASDLTLFVVVYANSPQLHLLNNAASGAWGSDVACVCAVRPDAAPEVRHGKQKYCKIIIMRLNETK